MIKNTQKIMHQPDNYLRDVFVAIFIGAVLKENKNDYEICNETCSFLKIMHISKLHPNDENILIGN